MIVRCVQLLKLDHHDVLGSLLLTYALLPVGRQDPQGDNVQLRTTIRLQEHMTQHMVSARCTQMRLLHRCVALANHLVSQPPIRQGIYQGSHCTELLQDTVADIYSARLTSASKRQMMAPIKVLPSKAAATRCHVGYQIMTVLHNAWASPWAGALQVRKRTCCQPASMHTNRLAILLLTLLLLVLWPCTVAHLVVIQAHMPVHPGRRDPAEHDRLLLSEPLLCGICARHNDIGCMLTWYLMGNNTLLRVLTAARCSGVRGCSSTVLWEVAADITDHASATAAVPG